ncbi:Taurine catabolism dioxygenase TauD/TfdA [Penicillium concentricum]|uniref:Taurine catabolism dioxygenase TauD/TfdA n=1 Tax=Penicillium concentricum TaxID=293559 RepID=A0A9W9SAF7_9EURO|nr:Taurine catabolism dioxygenase TauD/TfdA [Penicillium concentricum]KAJ5374415.1 Taurine catabolism dioxygenase TauD/TfdA [Penicillium concentricum]
MAPGLVETTGVQTFERPVKISVFPDGFKTSGQHPPIYSQVRPYADFPKIHTGPTLWKAEDYREKPELWTHRFTEEEVTEISYATDQFIQSGTPLTGISKANFHLPNLSKRMENLRQDLINGKGFFRFRGLPVLEWDLQKCATAYMGLGTYLGYFVSQNGRGHVLGHVKDLGEDPTKTDRVRIYRTNARQYFHTDGSDIVGLLCIAKSLSGGESDIASTHHVFNVLQERHPDVAQTLCEPNWYFDRKGEVSEGEENWIRGSVFYLENDNGSSTPRVYARLDPNNVTSLARFNSGPDARIPPLSDKQKYALEVFEKTCAELSLHMILAPGDIQFLSNSHVFHARTAYTDHPAGAIDDDGRPARRRHLMRLWLSAPESEGGWKLPYHDSLEKKRGGIQVNDTPPVCPLDAE